MKTTLTLLPIEFYRLLFGSDLGIFGPVLLILLGLGLLVSSVVGLFGPGGALPLVCQGSPAGTAVGAVSHYV